MSPVTREKASNVRCEECGGWHVQERVYVNPHTKADGSDLRFTPIEGAEFFQCQDCGWILMTTRKTLDAIDELRAGRVVLNYKEGGNSMLPLIKSMQPVHLMPCDPDLLEKNDIVLVRVGGKIYTHLISAVDKYRVQISNNHGKVNGWTPKDKVYGIVTHVDGNLKTKALRKVPLSLRQRLPDDLLK